MPRPKVRMTVEGLRFASERARATSSTIASTLLHLALAAPAIAWSLATVHPRPPATEEVVNISDTGLEGVESKLGAAGELSTNLQQGEAAPSRAGAEVATLAVDATPAPSPEDAVAADFGGVADLHGGREPARLEGRASGAIAGGRGHSQDSGRSRSGSRAFQARPSTKGSRLTKRAAPSNRPVGAASIDMNIGPPNAADVLLYGDGRGNGAGGGPQDGAMPPRLGGYVIWNCPWPATADHAGIDEGMAHLTADVDASGNATAAQLVDDDGYGFGPQAVRCALDYHFIPGHDAQGQPVPGRTEAFAVKFNRVHRLVR